VEVFPVQIKLDYKPKRVDYGALKEGRTIELMNFFHFEGAEMTLRHLTLSGVGLFLDQIKIAVLIFI
jgi:autophagy-related protein 2